LISSLLPFLYVSESSILTARPPTTFSLQADTPHRPSLKEPQGGAVKCRGSSLMSPLHIFCRLPSPPSLSIFLDASHFSLRWARRLAPPYERGKELEKMPSVAPCFQVSRRSLLPPSMCKGVASPPLGGSIREVARIDRPMPAPPKQYVPRIKPPLPGRFLLLAARCFPFFSSFLVSRFRAPAAEIPFSQRTEDLDNVLTPFIVPCFSPLAPMVVPPNPP